MAIQSAETITPDHTEAVHALRGRLVAHSAIYKTFLSEATIHQVQHGTAIIRLPLTELHVNSKGSLHGAVSATIVDFTTGLAIASWDGRESTGASVDMHISYLSAAAGVGDVLEIESVAERVGGSLAFVTIRIFKMDEDRKHRKTLVTLAQHTKYVQGTGPRLDT